MAKVNDNPELLRLAQDLLKELKAHPNEQIVINQNISNVKYAATSGAGPASIGNITENQTSKDDSRDS